MTAWSRAKALLLHHRWLIAVLAALAYWFAMDARWRAGSWLVTQLRPLPGALLSSPIPVGMEGDINFWFGQAIGVVVICATTFFVINTSDVFDNRLLTWLFRSNVQRMVVRQLFLRSVKDVVFMFTSRQVCRWFFRCPLHFPSPHKHHFRACVVRPPLLRGGDVA